MTSSARGSKNWKDETIDLTSKSKRLELATGALGLEMLQDGADREHRRLKAQEKAIHKLHFGEDMPESEDDEMRQTILGDQITYQQQPELKKRGLGVLASLVLGALVPGAGFAGYLIADALQQDPPPVIQQSGEDETADLGLGRIEDYDSAD